MGGGWRRGREEKKKERVEEEEKRRAAGESLSRFSCVVCVRVSLCVSPCVVLCVAMARVSTRHPPHAFSCQTTYPLRTA